MRVLPWALVLTSAVAYAIWRHFAAEVYVGNLPPFDLHLYGYEEALAYLAALTPEAKAVYLGPLHRADTALLLALAATLMLPVWRRGWLWCCPALSYAGFDVFENGTVSALLRHGIREAGEVAAVSVLTALKFGFLALAVALAIWSLWRGRVRWIFWR